MVHAQHKCRPSTRTERETERQRAEGVFLAEETQPRTRLLEHRMCQQLIPSPQSARPKQALPHLQLPTCVWAAFVFFSCSCCLSSHKGLSLFPGFMNRHHREKQTTTGGRRKYLWCCADLCEDVTKLRSTWRSACCWPRDRTYVTVTVTSIVETKRLPQAIDLLLKVLDGGTPV